MDDQEIEQRRGKIPIDIAKKLIAVVQMDDKVRGAWKSLAADLKPLYANRKEMTDDAENLRALILCGFPHKEQRAYDYDKSKDTKSTGEDVKVKHADHTKAVTKLRVIYNRVLDYCYPMAKAKPTEAALKSAGSGASSSSAAAGGGASSSSSSAGLFFPPPYISPPLALTPSPPIHSRL